MSESNGFSARHDAGALDGSHVSPSLSTTAGGASAYELKFFLDPAQADEVFRLARARLRFDPHADPTAGHSYHTTSLYCDTPAWEVFHRRGEFKNQKHRLRRYGQGNVVFLERKSKWGDRVQKQRAIVPVDDMDLLRDRLARLPEGDGWFHAYLQEKQLTPVCRISYNRVALVGLGPDGVMRLTFDRRVRGWLTRDWTFDNASEGLAVLQHGVIVEMKYRAGLPALFKELIRDVQLTPATVSKYRAFLRATGVVADGRAVDA